MIAESLHVGCNCVQSSAKDSDPRSIHGIVTAALEAVCRRTVPVVVARVRDGQEAAAEAAMPAHWHIRWGPLVALVAEPVCLDVW